MRTFNSKSTSPGYSQTRSSILRASRFNKSDENNYAKRLASLPSPPSSPPKSAKAAAPMRRGADCENISTLDTLLGYMEKYPKVASSASGAAGKPGKKDATGASTTSSTAPKPVKPAVLLEAKSTVDMPDLLLSGHQSNGCIVSSQKGVDKPQAKADQKQQTAKAEQQQKPLGGSIAVVVRSERDIKQLGTKRTSAVGERNGNEVHQLNSVVETDKAKPTSGQKRPLSFFDIHIPKKARREQQQQQQLINKRQPPVRGSNNPQPRRQPINKRPASVRDYDEPQPKRQQPVNKHQIPDSDSDELHQQQPVNKRQAPVRDSDNSQPRRRPVNKHQIPDSDSDEPHQQQRQQVNKRPAPVGDSDEPQQQQPATKRARILSKPAQNGSDTDPALSSTTLWSSPPASVADSNTPPRPCKSAGLPASGRRQATLLIDARKVRERQSKKLMEAQRLIQYSSQPKNRPAKRDGKTTVDIDKPSTKIMWNPCFHYTPESGYTGGSLPAKDVYQLHEKVARLDKPKRPAKRRGNAKQPRRLY